MAKARVEEKVIESSGNVYADLGFENPQDELAKAQLVSAISQVIASKGLTRVKAAEALGLDQPQVSRLLRGRTSGFSTDRLLRLLNELDQDVEITIRPKPADLLRSAHVSVATIRNL